MCEGFQWSRERGNRTQNIMQNIMYKICIFDKRKIKKLVYCFSRMTIDNNNTICIILPKGTKSILDIFIINVEEVSIFP